MNIFTNKVSIIYLLLAAIIGGGISKLVEWRFEKEEIKQNLELKKQIANNSNCDYTIHGLKGYKYIKPIFSAEKECESKRFAPEKQDIVSIIENEKNSGLLTYASVYVEDFNNGEWMVINPDQGYHPGSLIKVAVMMSYLRMAETIPGLLDLNIKYNNDHQTYPEVAYKAETIEQGKQYKIKELLYYMIAYSDNRATQVLENYLNMEIFKKTFTDMGMKELNFSDTSYRITANGYSVFFKALYNVGYLTIPASEYADSLLTESKFKDGIIKLLPQEVKVSHKFGEWGDGYNKELHETGIIYIKNHPYLISIMTRGTDWNKLSDVISRISKLIYDKMEKTSI